MYFSVSGRVTQRDSVLQIDGDVDRCRLYEPRVGHDPRRISRVSSLPELIMEGMYSFLFFGGVTMVIVELITGHAVVGWSGRMMLASRRKLPGPYWFSILLHLFLLILVPAMIYFGRTPS